MIQTSPKRSGLVKSDYTNNIFAMTIGSNILHWRKYKGISQQELAQKASITQASISEIENGEWNPTIDTISRIAQALDTKIELITKNRISWKMIEAVDYMTQKLNSIDILKAMKLLYFADLESFQRDGNKVIWLQYIRRNRWPFNQDIYQLNDIFEKKGEKYTPQNFKTYFSLTTSDKGFLDQIVDHYGKYKAVELMNMSYDTPPMKWFKKWDEKWMGEIVL